MKAVLTGNNAYLIKDYNSLIYHCKRIRFYILQKQSPDKSDHENILTLKITQTPVFKNDNFIRSIASEYICCLNALVYIKALIALVGQLSLCNLGKWSLTGTVSINPSCNLSKQCRPWSDAAFYTVYQFPSADFAKKKKKTNKQKKQIYQQHSAQWQE